MRLDWKAILAAGAVIFFAARSLRKTFMGGTDTVVDAINPLDDDNIFSKGSDAITDFFSQDGQELSTGSRFYDLLNPDSGKELGYMQYKAEDGKFYGRYDDDSPWEFIKDLAQ